MSSTGDGPEIAIRITADSSGAESTLEDTTANFDQMGLSGAKAARSITSGIGGLMSAEQGIYNAQMRVNVATISYTLAVREYGSGSIQAAKALDQLNMAQNSVTIANDQLTLRYVQFALTTGPQVYTSIMRMIAASQGMTLQNYMETASWTAKAAAIAATAVALSLATLGISALLGGAGAAAVSSQVTQTNNFNAGGTINPSSMINQTNQGITSAVQSGLRP